MWGILRAPFPAWQQETGKKILFRLMVAGLAAALSAGAAAGGLLNRDRVLIGGKTYFVQNANRAWSLTTEGGDPPCIFQFEVRSGDRWIQETQTDHVERSEVESPTDETNAARDGQNVWTAYQFKIEPGLPSTAKWVVLGDWHVRPDAGDILPISSPWQIELRPGDFLVFDMRASTEKPILHNAPEQHIWTSPAPIARGVWHSLVSVADFDWRARGGGGVTVWLDGAKVADYRGPFGYNNARQPYFKFGIYREAAPETLAVDYANVDTSEASLDARIHAPRPICGRK